MVFYNRSNEAAQQLKAGDFDWASILAGGVRIFHSGGIFAALSPTTPEVIIEGMKAAKAKGALCSFDLNYREKLWKIYEKDQPQLKAQAVMSEIVSLCDIIVGNEEDLQVRGLPPPPPPPPSPHTLSPRVRRAVPEPASTTTLSLSSEQEPLGVPMYTTCAQPHAIQIGWRWPSQNPVLVHTDCARALLDGPHFEDSVDPQPPP